MLRALCGAMLALIFTTPTVAQAADPRGDWTTEMNITLNYTVDHACAPFNCFGVNYYTSCSYGSHSRAFVHAYTLPNNQARPRWYYEVRIGENYGIFYAAQTPSPTSPAGSC